MSSSLSPPPYLFTASPHYSPEPSNGERRLCIRPRAITSDRARRDGIFIRKSNNVTVLLNDQEKNCTIPVYGRHSTVNGSIHFDWSELISEVSLKFSGNIEFLTTAQGFHTVSVIEQNITLFASQSDCPQAIPFSFVFPETFHPEDGKHPVPISYDIPLHSGQFTKCSYSLMFFITKAVHKRTPWLKSYHREEIPIIYHPRSHPPRPVLALNTPFFQTIKLCPEEWWQFVYTLNIQGSDTIACQLYLPSVGIFGLHDTIPFFLQFTGSRTALRHLKSSNSDGGPPIRLYLLRQMVVKCEGDSTTHHQVIAEATLSAVPPGILGPLNPREEQLNWQGGIELGSKIDVPSFDAGSITTDYFVTLEILLPEAVPRKHRYGHHVRLVTNSWTAVNET